jgi:hypothetical protein
MTFLLEARPMEAMFGIFLLFFIANIVLVIWALVDAIKVPNDSMFKAGNKLIWVLVIVLTGMIGAIIYLVVGRPEPGGHPAGRTSIDPNQPPPPPPGALG